ncbi:MAG: SpoIIE family protein phosphatase [Blastocatellia bacterium]|nr:SpoIIE family protein phosphatase [Blastocatellia bacterium]
MHKQPRWFWLVLWLWPLAAHAQDAFTLTAASLQNGQAVELDKLGWKYSPNDDPRFADPQFDDHAWETLSSTAIMLNNIPKSGWQGIGWFRLRLKADPALASQSLALVMVHYGASEIYLDGKLVERFGTVGTTPETEVAYNPNTLPIYITLDARDEHVLAVRHSCMEMRDLSGGWGRWLAQQSFRGGVSIATNRTIDYGAGFGLQIADAQQTRDEQVNRRAAGGNYLLNIGLMLAIGSLHLLLFWFYPRERGSLFFGLLTYAFAAHNSLLYSQHFGHQSALRIMLHAGGIQALTMLRPGMLLAFMYTVFALRIPKWFWFWAIAALLYIPLDLLFVEGRPIFGLYFFAIILFPVFEVVRGMRKPIRNRVAGACVVGVAMLAETLYLVIVMVVLAGNLPGTFVLVTLRSLVPLILTIAFSVFLARRFARTSLELEDQLAQVKQLSAAALEHEKVKAEHDRKTKELEEARQLQLSMLPKTVPQLPHLDIAAYMKTATEVGGDYYDFHLGEDGTLTIAVGDATGHGLKAGTMVASVKSLFVTLAYHPDIPHIFTRLSQTLKQMNLRGLFMAMTIAKVKDNRLMISLAGMPPVWLYRAANQQIEEVALQQLPLGGVTKYVYQQREYELASGDVVVLLSDGLPERFNPAGAMLEDETAKQWLTEHAHLPAQALIEGLAKLGDEWGGARPPDDDVTLVVLKVK